MSYKEQFDSAYMTVKTADKFEAQMQRLHVVIRRHANKCLPQPVAATLIDGVHAATIGWGFDGLDSLQECIQLLDPELDSELVTNQLYKDWVEAPSGEQEPLRLLMSFLDNPASGFGENEDLSDFVHLLYHSFGLMSMLLSVADIDEAVADIVCNITTELELFWHGTGMEDIGRFCDIADSLQ